MEDAAEKPSWIFLRRQKPAILMKRIQMYSSRQENPIQIGKGHSETNLDPTLLAHSPGCHAKHSAMFHLKDRSSTQSPSRLGHNPNKEWPNPQTYRNNFFSLSHLQSGFPEQTQHHISHWTPCGSSLLDSTPRQPHHGPGTFTSPSQRANFLTIGNLDENYIMLHRINQVMTVPGRSCRI